MYNRPDRCQPKPQAGDRPDSGPEEFVQVPPPDGPIHTQAAVVRAAVMAYNSQPRI